MTIRESVFILFGCLALAGTPVFATTYYVGGSDPGSNWWAGTWGNLQSAVNTAASGDVVKVSGNLTRSAGDTAGSITLVNAGITLSGGWNSGFTAKVWGSGGRLADELPGYSVLDANGSDTLNNRFRVLTISNTAANVKIEGFAVTGGYSSDTYEYMGGHGGGIEVGAWGARLSHLYVYGNTSYRSYQSCSGISIESGGALLEYLTIVGNNATCSYLANPYGGALTVWNTVNVGNIMVACCVFSNNIAPGGTYGVAIDMQGPKNCPSVVHWTVFGSLIATNAASSSWTVCMAGHDNGRCNLVNITVVDNRLGIGVAWHGGIGNWERDNYFINCLLADTKGCQVSSDAAQMKFKNTLIDPETPALGGPYYFDAVTNIDLTGNITNAQPLFKDQPHLDYRISDFSPAKGAAQALYSSSGSGFAYVDVDRNGSYSAGVDVIVDIVQGTGQYVPSASEYYYPRDINAERWLSSSRYSSNSNLVGKISMGALAPKSRRGMVITLK